MGHGCCSCCDEVPKLRQEVAELKKLVTELLEKVKRNSRNSSMPPSSDGPETPAKPEKSGSGKKPGGQPGHQRHLRPLAPEEAVEQLFTHKPAGCRSCGALLLGEDGSPERLQRLELVEGRALLVEHQLHTLVCLVCQTETKAALPAGLVRGPLGTRLIATIVLLTGGYRLSKRLVVALLADLFGIQIGLGTVSACEQQISEALEKPVEEARDFVKNQPIKSADETTWKEGAKRAKAWLWVAVTPLVTVFLIQSSRATEAARQLLGAVYGVLITDRLGSYNWWPLRRRQICWAHLKRHFQRFVDAGGEAARIGEGLQKETRQLFVWWRRVRDGTISRKTFRGYVAPLRMTMHQLLRDGAACSHKKTAGTCSELLKLEPAMWTFVRINNVEPTNNLSERSLRTAVIWRKLSFGTHSATGSRFVERMLTTTTTLRQQGRDVLNYLSAALQAKHDNRPALPLTPAPTGT